jgi:ABC-type multidrug transport system fused ATPase/permease subunit
MNLSKFIVSYVATFYLSWRMASVTRPVASLLIAAGMLYGRTLIRIARKMHAKYNESTLIAEQAISSIRTVYSFVGEEKAIAKFSSSLAETRPGKGVFHRWQQISNFCVVGIHVMVWKSIDSKSRSERRKDC